MLSKDKESTFLDNYFKLSIIVKLTIQAAAANLLQMKYISLLLLFFITTIVGFTQELTPKQNKGKWGFVNAKDEWIVKAKFSEVKVFSEELACVRVKNKWGFINKEGKKVIPFQYSNALSFKNGLAAVRSYKPLDGDTRDNHNQFKWGFVNSLGTLVIPFQFKLAQDFDIENRAQVQYFNMKSNEYFWIDPTGKAISPPFTKIIKDGENFKIQNNRRDEAKVYRYITKTGESITDWYLNDFNLSDTLIKVWLPTSNNNDTLQVPAFKGNSKKKLCAFINKEGKVLSGWYSEIQPFLRGYAPIRHHHLYGFINEEFKLVTTPKYRELSVLRADVYKGQVEYGKTVLLDYKGEEFSLFCFDFENFTGDLYLGHHQLKSSYRSETEFAVFDAKGNQMTSWFNKVHGVHNGIVRVEDERLNQGEGENRIYEMMYNYVSLESGELLSDWRTAATLSWEFDKQRKDSVLSYLFLADQVLNLDLDFFSTLFVKEFDFSTRDNTLLFTGGDFHNGMALVAIKKGEIKENRNGLQVTKDVLMYGYIDWYGDLVIPYRYKEAAAFRDEYAVVGDGTMYGAINSKGRRVLPQKYLMLGAYGSGLFPVLNEKGLWGYVNREGRVQIEYQYDRVMPYSYGYASVKKGRNWGLIDVMGNELMRFDYKKPIEVISPHKVKFLQSGVGYLEKRIDEL